MKSEKSNWKKEKPKDPRFALLLILLLLFVLAIGVIVIWVK
jgi:hypothetical protein